MSSSQSKSHTVLISAARILIFTSALFIVPGCSSNRVSLNPNSGDIVRNLGGDLPENAALIGEDNIAKAHYEFLRGELAFQREEFSDALTAFQKAAALDSRPSLLLSRRLAQLYLRDGKLDNALSAINDALKTDASNIDLLQLKAGILISLERSDEAIAIYQQIIQQSKELRQEPYVLLATVYAQKGKTDEAEKILHELEKKAPDSYLAQYYLGKISEVKKDFASAEKYYRKLSEVRGGVPSLMMDLARTVALQKRYPEAQTILEQVLALDPKNPAARNLLAQILLVQNRYKEAIDEFEVLGKMNTDSMDTRLKIALIKLQNRKFEDASVDLQLVLAKEPKNTIARYYLGSAYAALNRVDDAVGQMKKIQPGQEYFIESRTFGAYLLRQTNKNKEAVELLSEAVDAKPGDVRLLALLGTLQREAKLYDGALKTTERLIAKEPKNDAHYFTLGVLYDEQGEKEKALQAMEQCLKVNENNANALNYIGYSWAEDGIRLDEAERYIRKAVSIEGTNGYFVDSLGWVLYRSNKKEEALAQMKHAVELVPDDAVILEHLAIVYRDLGQKQEALHVYQQALQHVDQSDDKEIEGRLKDGIRDLQK